MKLLRLKIGDIDQPFRSLRPGFEIRFRNMGETEAMANFNPFCLAGRNGSGKSNVLEALSAIFYHLEFCVARYLPDNFARYFRRESCAVDAFTLEYLIGHHNRAGYAPLFFDKVRIEKQKGQEPQMFVLTTPYEAASPETEVSLRPSQHTDAAAEGKRYLPAHIIGYSSGENEILSLPFIKSRLVHLDEFRHATREDYREYTEPENSLIYIDSNMSQAVLLCCLLFEDPDTTLLPLKKEVGITGIRSFRMCINQKTYTYRDRKGIQQQAPLIQLLEAEQIPKLKACATSWYKDNEVLYLDFFVTEATRDAFRHHFSNAFELFQLLRLLYELNAHFIDERIVEEVYRSQGIYTDGKLPVGGPADNVFYFEDFYIVKKNMDSGEERDLLLRNLSDGEHQFLHTIGICLLLKDRRALLLLDEPETHFNPSWRGKFIKILNDSISVADRSQSVNGSYNIHYLKDILLTSHSPFIISDCKPAFVVLFEKNADGTVTAERVVDMETGFNTFGTSVEYILDRLFDYDQSIGSYSNDTIDKIDFETIRSAADVSAAKATLKRLGESIEKDIALARLNHIKTEP